MLNRWRLLLAGLLAFVALASGLAFAFFPVPERLELLLGLILLVAPIFAAWSLYRWCTKRQLVVPHVPRRQPRRPLALPIVSRALVAVQARDLPVRVHDDA